MQTPRLLAVLSGVLVGIACSDNTSSPTVFKANLLTATEIPAPTGTTSLGGTATVTLGSTDGTLSYTMVLTGTSSSAITQAHIHTGATGSTGPVRVSLCGTGTNNGVAVAACPASPATIPNTTIVFPNGSFVLPNGGNVTFDGLVSQMRSFTTYVNVHTTTNPNGEARGELLFAQ